jgi:hypothetical protein
MIQHHSMFPIVYSILADKIILERQKYRLFFIRFNKIYCECYLEKYSSKRKTMKRSIYVEIKTNFFENLCHLCD